MCGGCGRHDGGRGLRLSPGPSRSYVSLLSPHPESNILLRSCFAVAFALLVSGCGGEPSPDTEAPQVTLTSPVTGVVRGSVPLAAQVGDNVGVVEVRFLVDGAAIGQPLRSAPFEATWNTDSVPNGSYSLTATALDQAGNQATSPPVAVTLTNVGALGVTVTSQGLDIDPDGYRVTVDGVDAGGVDASGSVQLPEVPLGDHVIGLAGVAGNCALHLPRSDTVTIAREGQAEAAFAVNCSLASGPTAERILFSRGNNTPLGLGPEQLHAVNADGTGHVQLTDDQFNYVEFAWSPDRTTILFASDRPGPSTYSLYLMDADGTNVRPVNESIRAGSASWSPDGQQIVYGSGGIWMINRDGTGATQITTDPTDAMPAWSPDGGRIAFARNLRLYVMNVDGSDLHPISDGLGGEGYPRWSPDGTRILYVGNRLVGLEVYVIQENGFGRRNVTDNIDNDTDAAWSPMGDRIVYYAARFHDAMELVPADGTAAAVPVLEGRARYVAWR
jgi:hypothetical protein